MESQTKVLTLISRRNLLTTLEDELRSAQFVVETVSSIKECLQLACFEEYKAVLIDSDALSFEDIVRLIQLLRRENPHAALFVLYRDLDLEQRLRLFDAGVDDCSCGPVFAPELTVRLGISTRLHQAVADFAPQTAVLRSGDVELDLVRHRASRSGKLIDLRPKEFLLLEYLIRHVNQPVSRAMILESVWNSSFEGLTNVVDVYISALRRKIDRDFSQKLIETNVGVGYTFTCAANPIASDIPAEDRVAREPSLAQPSRFAR